MTRKELLDKLADLLADALCLMENTEVKPDDADEVWFAVNEAHSLAMDHLRTLLANEKKDAAKNG